MGRAIYLMTNGLGWNLTCRRAQAEGDGGSATARSSTGFCSGRGPGFRGGICRPVFERILRAVQADADAEGRIDWSMVSVDSTSCRAHQHAAGALTRAPKMPSRGSRPVRHRSDEALGRSRGGLTCKIHLAGEGGRRPLGFVITPGQWGDAPQMIPVLEEIRVSRPDGGRPRTRPDHLGGDKAYSSRRNRRHLRRRQIKHTIAEPRDQRANRQRRGSKGGRPTGFDRTVYRRRNEVERTINRLKTFRAIATRYDKRAYVYGTVTVAAIRLWLGP